MSLHIVSGKVVVVGTTYERRRKFFLFSNIRITEPKSKPKIPSTRARGRSESEIASERTQKARVSYVLYNALYVYTYVYTYVYVVHIIRKTCCVLCHQKATGKEERSKF